MTRYKVVGDCAHVTTMSANGRIRKLLYKPAPVPADVPQSEIDHLLSVKLIAAVADMAEPDDAEVDDDTDPTGPPSIEVPQVDEVEVAARAAAQAELPADGVAPKKNASHAVWIEYAVSQGRDYEAAKSATRDELIALCTTV